MIKETPRNNFSLVGANQKRNSLSGLRFFCYICPNKKLNVMKKVLILALSAVLALGVASEKASAQKFELGARAGIASQNMNIEASDVVNGKAKVGWHAAVVSRIRLIGFGDGLLGAGLFFQPEVVYSQSNQKGEFPGGATKISMKTVDVPLLLSLKVSLVRVQLGPVFNLMNNFSTVGGDLEFLPLRPAVGYAAGASVDLGALVIDARYHGDFKNMSFKGDWADIKSRFSSWSVGVGLMF
jgi:hypothetical protein